MLQRYKKTELFLINLIIINVLYMNVVLTLFNTMYKEKKKGLHILKL